jgi:hypothetical protein
LQLQAELAALHGVVRIVRHDVLVLSLDAGEQLEEQRVMAELIADQTDRPN